MRQSDLLEYFTELDNKLISLKDSEINDFVFNEFPNYPHIGKYIDPRIHEHREFYSSEINNNLNDFSFDPLISFNMDQIKYSVEILHPDCNCFRRSKIKERPIKTTSHRDRILYASWNYYLSEKHKNWIVKNNLKNSISAYVPKTGKFNAHYAKTAFDYLQNRNEYSAIALDIKSFFDNIPHKVLKENLIHLLNIGPKLDRINFSLFKATTKYTYIELDQLKPNLRKLDSGDGMYMNRGTQNWKRLRSLNLIKQNLNEGIPQGLPCSGVLANIVMMQFDLIMKEYANNMGGIYLRYADDIFIASPNKKTIAILTQKCQSELKKLNLPIAHKKTEEFEYNKSMASHPTISYLGLNCNGNKISVRRNGINKFYQRTSQYIYSYVHTCMRRNIEPSRKKIRAIFTHSGKQNFYSYLRRVSKVFENDPKYDYKKVKSVLKNHVSWIDKIFDNAKRKKPSRTSNTFKYEVRCNCPLRKDK